MRINKPCISLLALVFGLTINYANAAEFDATVQFANKITLSVPVSGQVSHINVQPGDDVKQGSILLSLNKTPFKASVAHEQANIKKCEALQKETRRDLDQLTELFERGVLSNVELENGKLKYQRVSADLSAIRSKLVRAKFDLEHTEVKAPVDGWILNVMVKQHEMVNNTVKVMPLISIAEKNEYVAVAAVPLSSIDSLAVGNKSKVSINNEIYSGKISSIGFEPVPTKGGDKLYEVQVKFNANGKLIRAGQTAKILF